MKQISEAKFDALIAKQIHLEKCRCGSGGGNIVIKLPYYGKTGAQVECPHCGRATKLYSIHAHIDDGKRFGTPVIDKSLLFGIKQAVAEWNGEEKNK